MGQSARWWRVAAVALLLWRLLVHAAGASATDTFTVLLPTWAAKLNAARDLANVGSRQVEHPAVKRQEQRLLAWASISRDNDMPVQKQNRREPVTDIFLLVGAKTSVVHGFARRQVIRQTWANASFVPDKIKVVFLGCESDLSMYSAKQQQQLQEAIQHEKRVFGDLLTSELLDCHDSFAGLAEKMKAFLLWSAGSYTSLAYVMIIDDDIYLRLDRLVALLRRPSTPRVRFFGGNTASSQYRGLTTAIRDPRNKYHVSPDVYPMRDLPPFLTGAHYIVSGDLVRFLARNVKDLRSIPGLDDVSVGLWLFSLLRIQPTYFDKFYVLRSSRSCVEDLISLADLSVPAIRHIHANIVTNRRVCEAFDDVQWMKKARGIVVPNAPEHDAVANATEGNSFLHWELQLDDVHQRLQIQVQVVVGDVAIDFVYVPSLVRAEAGFCGQAASQLQQKLYLVVGYEVCAYYSEVLITALAHAMADDPALGPMLWLAKHNLRRMQIDDAAEHAAITAAVEARVSFTPTIRPTFTVVLSNSTRSMRALFESLFADLISDRQVLVLDDDSIHVQAIASVDMHVLSRSDGSEAVESAHVGSGSVLLIDDGSSPRSIHTFPENSQLVFFTDNPDTPTTNAIFLPAASRVFANTLKYTPMLLLRPRDDDPQVERAGLRVLSDCQSQQPHSPELTALIDTVEAVIPVTRTPHCTCASRLHLDKVAENLRGAAFVVVETSHNVDLSDRVLVAFLAGAIPVTVGSDGGASSRLFNPDAVIDCGAFNDPVACARRIVQVHASPALRSQMRQQPPIVDLRVFQDAFSWHPEVVAAMTSHDEKRTGVTRMSVRLGRLIKSSGHTSP